MIEFEIDMEYCLDRNRLDCVILHDENEEMDEMVFVPERTCKDNDGFCSECGHALAKYAKKVSIDDGQNIIIKMVPHPYCYQCGAKVVE